MAMVVPAKASSTPHFPTLSAERKGEASVKKESAESAPETVLRGRTLVGSDKEILTLAQRLYDRHAQNLQARSLQEITADAAEVRKTFVRKGGTNEQKSPQIRRIRAKRANSQKASLDVTASLPYTPRPPSLSVVCASIQSELGPSANEERLPKMMTLDQFWEQKSAEVERSLRIEHGDRTTIEEEELEGMGSLRPCAGSLDRDPILSATALPSSHVEAWLSTVLARCGEELNVFYEQANELRQSVGLVPIPRYLPDFVVQHCCVHAKTRPATVSLTEDCAYISPQDVNLERRSSKDSNFHQEVDHRDSMEAFEPQTQKFSKTGARRIRSALGKNEGRDMSSQWLSSGKHLDVGSAHETEPETRLTCGLKKPIHSSESRGRSCLSSADTTLLQKFRAERLALLALDRQTLEALGLDSATVDRTYRALYVHSVGAHLLVRRACKHTAPKYRAKLAAALWLMFMYLVEGTEDVQYKSAVSQLRIASVEFMKKATWKSQIDSARERDARRVAENEAREVDSFVAALVADTAKTKELQRESMRIAAEREKEHSVEIQRAEGARTDLLEKCKRHEAQAAKSAVCLALSAYELDNCRESLSTAYARTDTISSELEEVRHHRNELQEAYDGMEQDRMTLEDRISSLESRVKRPIEPSQSLRLNVSRPSHRVILDSKHVSIQTDATQLIEQYQDSLTNSSDEIDAQGDSRDVQIANLRPSLGTEIDWHNVAIQKVLRLIQLVERNLSILRVTHGTELKTLEGFDKNNSPVDTNISPIDTSPAPSNWQLSTCAILHESEPEQHRAPATCVICLDSTPFVDAGPLADSEKTSGTPVGAPMYAPAAQLDRGSSLTGQSQNRPPMSHRQTASRRSGSSNSVDGCPNQACADTHKPAQREIGFVNSLGTSCKQNARPPSQAPERIRTLDVSKATGKSFKQMSQCQVSNAAFDTVAACSLAEVKAEGHNSVVRTDLPLLSCRQVEESPAPALAELVTNGFLENYKNDGVSAVVVSTNAFLQIAAQETASKLLGVSWMRAYIQSLANECMMKLRIDYLSNRLSKLENEALPASIAAFAANQAIGISVEQKAQPTQRPQEDATSDRTTVENRRQLVSTQPDGVENVANLRGRIVVLQKTALELGTQRDQAHEMTLQARKELLESQKSLAKKSELLVDFHARDKVREEEHVGKLNSLRQAKEAAELQTAKLKQQNAALTEKLRRILQGEFAQADARAVASAQLFRATVSSINGLLAEHSRRARQEAEDWRRRGLLHGPRITSMLVKYVRETGRKCFRQSARHKLPPAAETYDPWPTEIISISSIDKAVDEEVVRPAIDLKVVGAALETALGNFLDQEAVDNKHTCMIDSTTGYSGAKLEPRVLPRISYSALRTSTSRCRQDQEAVLPCGECIHSLGIMAGDGLQAKAAKVNGVTPLEGHQLYAAMATAAAAAVRRLGRELSLMQQETQSSNKERDYLMRQIVEHYARYDRLNSRCESLAADAKCAERDHKSLLEQKEQHYRKLIANSRRLKEHCEAEMKKVAEVLSDAVSGEREAQEKIHVLQELTCMASADGESREVRSWERAFMAHTLTTAKQAVMAAKNAWIVRDRQKVSPFEQESALSSDAIASQSPDKLAGTNPDVSDGPVATAHFNEAHSCHHTPTDAGLSNLHEKGALAEELHMHAPWFEERKIPNLNRIWMSPQQRTLLELRGTYERLTNAFSTVQEQYQTTRKRVHELSHALNRLTAEHVKLQTSYQQELYRNKETAPQNEHGDTVNSDFKNTGDPRQVKPSSESTANIGHGKTAKDVSHDASVQTGLTLLCRRQVQTDLTWVHSCLQSQHPVQIPLAVKRERADWTDASPMIETASGSHVKLHCTLFREPGGTKVVPKNDRLTVAASDSDESVITERASPAEHETCIPPGLTTSGDSITRSLEQCKVESLTEAKHRKPGPPVPSTTGKAHATDADEGIATAEPRYGQERNCEAPAICPDSSVAATQSAFDFASINISPGVGVGSYDMLRRHASFEANSGEHNEKSIRTNEASSSKLQSPGGMENQQILNSTVAHAPKQADDEGLLRLQQSSLDQTKCDDFIRSGKSDEQTYSVSQIVIAEAALRGQQVPDEIEVALSLIAQYRNNLKHIDANVESESCGRNIAVRQKDSLLQLQAKPRTNTSTKHNVSPPDFLEITTNAGDAQIPANTTGHRYLTGLSQERTEAACDTIDQTMANAEKALEQESRVSTVPTCVDDNHRDALHRTTSKLPSKESVATLNLNFLQLRDACMHEDIWAETRVETQDAHNVVALDDAAYSESLSKGVSPARNFKRGESRYACRNDDGVSGTCERQREMHKDAKQHVVLVHDEKWMALTARIRELVDSATDSVSHAEAVVDVVGNDESTRSERQKWDTTRCYFPPSLLDFVKAATLAGDDPVSSMCSWFDNSPENTPDGDMSNTTFLRRLVFAANNTKGDALAASKARLELLTRLAHTFECGESNAARREDADLQHPTNLNQSHTMSDIALDRRRERAALCQIHKEHHDEEDECSAPAVQNGRIVDAHFRVRDQASSRRRYYDARKSENSCNESDEFDDESDNNGNDVLSLLHS